MAPTIESSTCRPEEQSPRPRKRIAIIQSAYIPWKGFFDLVARCDEYVVFDTVQYAKRHWHNRNRIKTPQGLLWLTIPVVTKSRFAQSIEDVMVAEPWAERHWASIESSYRKAPFFDRYARSVRDLYEAVAAKSRLTEINEVMLEGLCRLLEIRTRISRDRAYAPQGAKTDRLLDICRKAGASHYLSGPSAKAYLDEDKFRAAGISVEWMVYPDYPHYPQLWGAFEHAVSVVDLIFNAGLETDRCWRTGPDGNLTDRR
jgi:hypothetical protein